MKHLVTVIVLMLAGAAILFFIPLNEQPKPLPTKDTPTISPTKDDVPSETIITDHLDTPWSVVVLPNGEFLTTERHGVVVKIDTKGSKKTITTIPDVREIGEGGLLGMTLDPQFEKNNAIYFYYTYSGEGNNTKNRVVRMTYKNNALTEEKIIMDAIPGATNHNGGEIAFGPDNYLYIATGDAQEPSQAQNTNSLAGKILRVTSDGKPAPGNPFKNQIYSYGHRNVQGLTWDNQGRLWATEHGRSGLLSGLDEINLIESGKNYGWPEIQGNETRKGMETAKKNSGNTTWAPGSITYLNGFLYFGGLRGQALYKAKLDDKTIVSIEPLLSGTYGRIREVIKNSQGLLYITTSNQDGRGRPAESDDKLIRINPASLK